MSHMIARMYMSPNFFQGGGGSLLEKGKVLEIGWLYEHEDNCGFYKNHRRRRDRQVGLSRNGF